MIRAMVIGELCSLGPEDSSNGLIVGGRALLLPLGDYSLRPHFASPSHSGH